MIDGIKVIKPNIYRDNRGFFIETWNKKFFLSLGIKKNFVQDNFSFSKNKGTFRGFHFQRPPFSQSKLVRCSKGSLLDIVIDIRKKSPTYGKIFSIKLSQKNNLQIFIPIGFLHGFYTLENNTEVVYKVSNFYSPKHEETIKYEKKILNLNLSNKISKTIFSKKIGMELCLKI